MDSQMSGVWQQTALTDKDIMELLSLCQTLFHFPSCRTVAPHPGGTAWKSK